MLLVALTVCTLQHPVLGEYGVDVTWPMHYETLRSHPDFEGQQKKYDDFMESCRQYYKDAADRCNHWEVERLAMNLRQPQSMVVSQTNETKIYWTIAQLKLVPHFTFYRIIHRRVI
jgi:hypothetical protein